MKSSNILRRSAQSFLRPSTVRPVTRLSKPSIALTVRPQANSPPTPYRRAFSVSLSHSKGLSPDATEPPPSSPESTEKKATEPSRISDDEYQTLSDTYLDALLHSLEEKAEDHSAGLEVEYTAGVLTLSTSNGTYVINKQPPNKQIWLSSPISGPKRFDWVADHAHGEHTYTKQDTEGHSDDTMETSDGGGKWVYLRDGTELTALLKDEVKVDFVVGAGEEEGTVARKGDETIM